MKQTVNESKLLAFCLMFVVLIAGVFIGFRQTQPPSPPSKADADYPAYQRMLANIKAMSVAPHVLGSKELEAVRSHILGQIEGMGLKPIVESSTLTRAELDTHSDTTKNPNTDSGKVVRPGGSQGVQAPPTVIRSEAPGVIYNDKGEVTLKNILVKLDAPNTDVGVLMIAHYDSKNVSPGAADNLLSVTALLEAMRSQAHNTHLKNDLYFLFTDGEEQQARGAAAFVKAHPELKQTIQLVVNLDARGDRGGLLMYQTSAHNYNLVHNFTSAVSTPIAFSFTPELLKHLPNGSDMTDFLNAGYTGLNFAIAEGLENYHQPTDSYQNVDRSSAYQFLLTTQELSSYAAHSQIQGNAKQDGVYFPFWPGNIVLMSQFAAYCLAGLAVLSAVAWIVLQIRRGKVRLKQVVVGTSWQLGAIAVGGLLSEGIVLALTSALHLNASSNTETIFFALSLVFAVGALTLFGWRMRKSTLSEAVAGLLPVQLLLIILSTTFLYSASYLFVLPTLVILAVVLLERNTVTRLVASTIFGIVSLLLYVPVCWLLYVLFTLSAASLVIGLGIMPITMIAALFLSSRRRE